MKKALILLCLIAFGVSGQVPQGINYQGAVYDNSTPVTNKQIRLKLSLLEGSATGTVIYSETHTPQTNFNGVFSIVLGNGINPTATFTQIDWSTTKFVKTEIDPNGGTSYSIISTAQLMSVPYALYAKTSDSQQNLSSVLNQGNDANNNKITNLADPTLLQDAVTKAYADKLAISYTFPQGISNNFVSFALGPSLNYTVPSGKNLYILQSGAICLVNGKKFWGQNFLFAENTQLVWDAENGINGPIYAAFIGFLVDKTTAIEPVTFTLTSLNSYVVPANKTLILKSWFSIPSIKINGTTAINRSLGIYSTFLIYPENTELLTPEAGEERGYTGYLITK